MSKKKKVKCQGQKVLYKQSSTHCSKIISKIKVFKKWFKLQGQGHRIKNNGTHRSSYHKEYSCEISKL